MICEPGKTFVACFDQALGDYSVVEQDELVMVNG
jgi:hypothetical protein